MQKIHTISFLLFDSFSNLCLANGLEPFRAANDLSHKNLFDWQIVTIDGLAAKSSSGIQVVPDRKLSDARGDLLVVMPSYDFERHSTVTNLQAIQSAAKLFSHLGGHDTGSWLLAKADLLEGYSATIHWDELMRFAEAFPDIKTVRKRMVWDNDRLTCAGAAAAFDVSMEIIGRQFGTTLRLEVALLFMDANVTSEPQGYSAKKSHVSRAISVMRENLETPLPIDEIAEAIGLEKRVLTERMKQEFGETSIQVYRRLRLLNARKLLLESNLSVSEIAVRTGYENTSAMSRAFRNAFGTTPRSLR